MCLAAADIDRTLTPPSGPPDPIKSGLELYGDVLLATGHAKEAAAVYEEQLLRTPNRTPSVKALTCAKGAQSPRLRRSLNRKRTQVVGGAGFSPTVGNGG